MNENDRIVALILAAGFSSRMGDFKPLLPVGGTPLIERAIARFLQAGFHEVRVIVGHRAKEVIPVVTRLGARPVFNVDYPSGMYSSVRAGVRTLGGEEAAFFLLPGDCLPDKPETLARIASRFREEGRGILHPTFGGKRGHPPLISAAYRNAILAHDPPGGLRALLAEQGDDTAEVEVDDAGILSDLDSPREYRKLLERLADEKAPSEERCLFLLERHGVADRAVAHSRVVAALARRIALPLLRRGVPLDLDVITAAGLLHDLAKGKPRHAEEGMRIITAWGYPAVAAAMGSHMDIVPAVDGPPTEGEILYLADRLVDGVHPVCLEERIGRSAARFQGDARIAEAIARRFAHAIQIKTRIEGILGSPLEAFPEDLERGGES
ncbi:MAG: DVU_1551 family NTP transferase [Thermodesulfobacteriota bacterium]